MNHCVVIPTNWRSLLPERIAKQIAEPDANGCWRWTGTHRPCGYVRRSVDGRLWYLHRYVYTVLVGPVPENLHMDHLCRVHDCCNPKHLEPVTQRENNRRGESPPAKNGRKTHCMRGHLLAEENLIPSKKQRGRRGCRVCNAEYQRDYYQNVTLRRGRSRGQSSETCLEGLS